MAAHNRINLYADADEAYTEDEFYDIYKRDWELIMTFYGEIYFLGEDLFSES